MNELESIAKLRKYTLCDQGEEYTAYLDAGNIADEIEAEIAERYMELPCDADGVPIHVGDELVYTDECGREFDCIATQLVTYEPTCYRHVKPRTIEDVLNEYYDQRGWDETDNCAMEAETLTAKYADEIRAMFGEVDG